VSQICSATKAKIKTAKSAVIGKFFFNIFVANGTLHSNIISNNEQ